MSVDPIAALAELLEAERDRVVRQWAKRLRAETYEVEVPGRDLKAPLEPLVDELARLLRDRGSDTLRLWPEVVRAHGARRFDQRFEAEDLVREFKALQEVLLYVYARGHGGWIEPEVAELVAEVVGEGLASAEAAYARVLKTEEVRFREAAVMESVLHHVEVGILLAEADGSISFVSPPVSRLVGVPMRAVMGVRQAGTLGALLSQVHARHYPSGQPFRSPDMPFMRVLRERRAVRGVMMVVERPDGGEAILELGATPVWEEGEDGLAGVIQTFTDRTESAQKSRALTSAHDELRRLQGRLLQRTRTQALGQLASGAAHALNNFLNVLRLRITLLRREFKPEHLDALDRTVRHIGELVGRLQEFSVQRTEEQLAELEPEQTVREALELARGELEQREHPIEVALQPGQAGKVRADPGFFRELVVNLLFAARDRMPEGGRLTVSTEAGDDQGWVALRIAGSPLYTPEELARLFDPLNRQTHTPHVSLMLAVARNQVQRWGGELTVENEPGPGHTSAFVVRLPRAQAPGAAAPQPAPAAAAAAAGPRRFQQTRRVLVVDDDVDNARMMAEVLGEEGYEVQVAHAGDVALKLWESRRFDAALLDALMPDMSGWELARELRQRSPHVLLAMVTGMDVRGQNRSNLALVDAIFRKPIDVGALDEFLAQSERPHDAGAEHTDAPQHAPAP